MQSTGIPTHAMQSALLPFCNLSAITGLQLRCNLQGRDISAEHEYQAGQQHARSQAPVMQELPDRSTVRKGPDHR